MNRKENQPQFQLEQAPKWFKRPSSVSWGFGGRLIIVKSHVFPDSTRISVVAGQIPCHDDDYLNRVNSLKTILNFPSIEYLSSFCQIKAQTDPAEKETWNFMNMLLAPEPAFVSDFLGIKEPIVEKKMNDLFLKLKISSSPIGEEELLNDDLLSTSMIDATLNQGSVLFEHVDALEFESQINANTPEYAINPLHKTSTNTPPIILSTPLKLLSSQSINKDEAEVDIAITKCVIVGNFESAVKLCLATERLADALAFAIQGGTELLERTQKEYFKRTSPKKSYARLLQGVVYKQAADTVANTDLDEGNGMAWKDVMAYLYTFANQKEITSSLSLMASKLVILVNKLPAIETTLTK